MNTTNVQAGGGVQLILLAGFLVCQAGAASPPAPPACPLFPIALPAATLSNASPNTVLNDVFQGQQPGHFGWLTWAGSPSVPALAHSLTAPGDSATYVNPDLVSDHQVSVGDWVQGKPGVSNSKQVRDALDALKLHDILVPVWNETRGQGEDAAYRVVAFARVRLLDYQLAGQNRIRALFLGLESCSDANLPPAVSAGPDQTITLPAGASLNGSASDDGLPAGGALTASWSVVSGPGTVTFANPGAPATTATFGTHGTYVLRLTASDSQLAGSDDVLITVNRENRPPVADGQVLALVEDVPLDIVLAGGDPDGDALSFAIVTGPAHGSLSGVPPNVRYTPFADYNGPDSFSFKVNDGVLDSAAATVALTVMPENDPPVADSQSLTNLEDTPLSLTLSGADVEGSPVTFTLLTPPSHGTLNVAPGTLATPTLTYTPAPNYHGPDSFTFKVNDGVLDSAPATIALTVVSVNDIPLVDAGPDQLVTLPTTSVPLTAVVSDDVFDGSTLAVAWTAVSGPGQVTFAEATNPVTTATFSASGTYVLRLSADDNFFLGSDDVVVTINAPPAVHAGTNQAVTLPAGATLAGSASDDGLPASGTLTVAWSKVSGPGSVIFSDPAATNATVSFGENGLYVLRLSASDGLATSTHDVTVIANRAPLVDAGSDQSVTNLSVTLTGTVADDGLPPGAAAAPLWTKVSGPGEVTFADETAPATTAVFSLPGIYVLRLSASDTLAEGSDEVSITATEPNEPPFAYAGPNQLVILPNAVHLFQATVTDDGVPAAGTLTVHWAKLMGPGDVTFADASHPNTIVTFSAPGNYILRLTADDGALTSHSDVTFVVKNEAMNAAPIVNAGADQSVGLTNQLALTGFADDDGLPRGVALSVQWTKVSGPGAVSFAEAASVSTRVTFGAEGAYVLRLTANDSVFTVTDEVAITVYPDNLPPVVEAGPDQTITISDPALLAGGTNGSWSLSASLLTVDRWNPAISQPGLSGVPPNVFAFGPALSRYSLATGGTNLYVAGAFTHAAGQYVYELASWDGAGWSPLLDPNPYWEGTGPIGLVVYDGVNSSVRLVTTMGGEVFVRGTRLKDFDNHGVFLDSGARWSGTNWNPWSPYFLGSGGGVDSLLASSNAVYYGGFFDFQPTNAVNDGRAPFFTHSGLPISHGVAKWDGTNWAALGDGISGQVGAMAIGKHGELYVAGAFMNNVSDGVAHNIAKWDGTNWTRLGAGLQGCTRFACYTLIIALAVDSEGAVYAAGDFTTAGGLPANGIAKWDGTNWSTLGTGADNGFSPGGGAQALATRGRDLYVGGAFSRVGGLPANNLAKWNGRFWSPLGTGSTNGVSGTVSAFAPTPNGIYVGGDFSLFDGSASDVALWEFAPPPSRFLRLEGRVTDDGRPPGAPLALAWSKVSGPGDVLFADAQSASTTAEFTQLGTYVLRLTASDSDLTAFDELTVIVQGNQPPLVDAGPDQVIDFSAPATLAGSVTDDGHPSGAAVPLAWSLVNGPGPVTFGNANVANTTARFSVGGTYLLRLTANDSQFSSYDDVLITVRHSDNGRPNTVARTSPETVAVGEFSTLTAHDLTDDGRPFGITNILWSQVLGPAPLRFVNPTSRIAQAMATAPGTYRVRVEVNDGELSFSSEYHLFVSPGTAPSDPNLPPAVSAGADFPAVAFQTATLNGSVLDDGLPGGPLLASWHRVSGPANVYFANAAGAQTTAKFYLPGEYVLRLTGSDGVYSASDEVTVTVVAPTNEAPFVVAGPDAVVVRPAPALLEAALFDDALPLGYAKTFQWSVDSGPGPVTFSPAAGTILNEFITASATFSSTGVYVLRITASDSLLTDSDTLTVTVLPGTNSPPWVEAGPDQSVALLAPALLHTEVLDDGLDEGLLQISWSKVSGPGQVYFSTLNGVYRASFDAPGTYVLRLTASDDELTASDDVTITVYDVPEGPAVAIHSPLDAGIVTAPAAIIGTVSSPILQSWSLRYRLKPAGDDDSLSAPGGEGQGEVAGFEWILLATANTSLTAAPLATFDPTLLLNGLYELQLTATDLVGRTATADTTLIVDRNMKVGHFTLSFNDLTIPVAGIPIQVIRTYDSRDKRVGDFGVGWTLDVKNIRLQKNRNLGANWQQVFTPGGLGSYCLDPRRPRTVTITFPDGRTHKFQVTTSPECQPFAPIPVATVLYQPLGNTRGSLVAEDTAAEVTTQGNIGGTDLFTDTFDTYNPALYRYTSDEGDVYLIHERDGLRSLTDRNGNRLTVSTNGITWTNTLSAPGGEGQGEVASLSIHFQRNPAGLITNIVDALGNAMSYRHDTNGNLVTFVDRVNLTNTFTYDNRHQLLDITDARGIRAVRNEYDASGRLIAQVDAAGRTNYFTHDLAARREILTDRLGNITTHWYDDNGNVLQTQDALGHVTRMAYDAADNLLEQIDALGNTNRFTYDTRDNKLSETDPLGNTTRYTYDGFSQITSITNPRGFATTNRYDADGNLIEERNALGHATSFAYDEQGNLLTITDALGNTVESQYDARGRLTNSISRDAVRGVLNQTGFTYDTNGNRRSVTVLRNQTGETGGVLPPVLETIYFDYDAQDRLTRVTYADGSFILMGYSAIGKPSVTTDPLGRQVFMDYDDRGNVFRTRYPDSTFELRGYDAENRLVAIVDRGGRTMLYTNDALGRRISMVNADGTFTRTTYDAIGRVTASTDERAFTTTFVYDPNCGCSGRRTMVIDPLGNTTHSHYDANGNEIAMTDASGRITRYEYDAEDRLTRTVFADGSTQTNYFDALDRQIAETDQAGNTTFFGYDSRDRLVAVTNALGHVTTFLYDQVDNLLCFTDAEGRTTPFAYDARGRRVERKLPGNQVARFRYDAAGNVTNYVDFNGRTTTYLYDVMNRLTARIPDAALNEPPVAFTYTATDQRATMSDASGVTTYAYNERDWLTNKVTPQGTLAYRYDTGGNVTEIRSSNANGSRLAYEYDALDRVIGAEDAYEGRTTLHFNSVGSLAAYRYPNGVSATNEFNALHWVTNVTSRNPQLATINQYQYSLNPAGKRAAVTEPGRRTVTYGYDALHRLTSELVTGAGGGSLNVNYSYDRVGNRLTRNAESSAYGVNDQLAGPTYDDNGNTTGAWLPDPFTGLPRPVADQYDFEDRLKARTGTLNSQPSTLNIIYDGDGNRVRKTVNGVTTLYLVDDLNPSGYAQVLEELTSSNGQPAVVTRTYAYDYALISQSQVLPDGQGGLHWHTSFYGYDDHGSVRYLTDTNGDVIATYDYDSFGELIQESGSIPNNYLYAGEQFDHDLGLYYLRARYLNPGTGRFWTRDPFEGYLDEPYSLNGYLYANADPMNNWDPSGYATLGETMQALWIRARTTIARLQPHFRKAKNAFCRVIRVAVQAQEAYNTVQGARELAAIGIAAGSGGVSFNEMAALVVQEAFDLRGLDDARLRRFDLQEVLDTLDTPCFAAGTLVATEHGLRPIEALEIGDRVWALGQATARDGLKPVTRIISSKTTNIILLTVEDTVIETTSEHPFWVLNKGWILASDLVVGDGIRNRNGDVLTIQKQRTLHAPTIVFNFEVDEFHTYFVGTQEILVHNPRRTPPPFRGGAYEDLEGQTFGGSRHRHHMPLKGAKCFGSRSGPRGPSISMDVGDHLKTKSNPFGPHGRAAAAKYLAMIECLCKAGRIRDAYAAEIRDVRRVAGRKYNAATREMLDYARKSRMLPKKSSKSKNCGC